MDTQLATREHKMVNPMKIYHQLNVIPESFAESMRIFLEADTRSNLGLFGLSTLFH